MDSLCEEHTGSHFFNPFHSYSPHYKTLAMSTFNAVRNHMALIQHDADSLLKDINRFEEDHEENCIGISQCDKEFAQAKAAEDKFKCKQRKLVRHPFLRGTTHANHHYKDRKQAEIQSEQAAKWEQYKIKAALVVCYVTRICLLIFPNQFCSMNCVSCAGSRTLSQRTGSVLFLKIATIKPVQ